MENVNRKLDDLIDYIKNTRDYKMCIKLRKQMDENKELKDLISDIKKLQKKYKINNYDKKIKEEINKKNK